MMGFQLSQIKNREDYWRHFQDSGWQQIAEIICRRHNLSFSKLERIAQGGNVLFSVDDEFIIKTFAPFFHNEYARERAGLEFVAGRFGIKIPEIVHIGEVEGWSYLVLTQLQGHSSPEVWFGLEQSDKIRIVSNLAIALNELHKHTAPDEPALNLDWQKFIQHQAATVIERQREREANPEWLESLPSYIAERILLLPNDFRPVMLHGDAHAGNLLLTEESGRWEIGGLIDFGDAFCGFHEYEFLAPGVLMMQGNAQLQLEFMRAYGYRESDLNSDLRARLMLLTVLHEWSDLRKYALRLAPEAVNFTLEQLETAIWNFCE